MPVRRLLVLTLVGVRFLQAGSTVVFTVKRNGETKTFTAHKGSRTAGAQSGESQPGDFSVTDSSYSFSSKASSRAQRSSSYRSGTTTGRATHDGKAHVHFD